MRNTAQILVLPSRLAVEESWLRYQRLAQAYLDSDALKLDPDHIVEMGRALEQYQKAALAAERAA